MFTVIHNTSMFCSMTLWQTVLKKLNLYFIFLLRKWIISSNKICQVVQCAMSKTSSQYVVAKTCTSLTITAYTFYFLWTCTPSAFSIWISCLIFNKKKCPSTNDVTISRLVTLYYFLSNDKAFWRQFLSVGVGFFFHLLSSWSSEYFPCC